MAEPSHHEAHHEDGGVHVHVHPPKLYAGILGGLLFLTIVTVAVSKVDIDGFLALGREVHGVGAWNLLVAVAIASTKATLVVLFFMHLKDDSRFNAVVFVGALLFIGVFFAYTMNDTAVRGTMDRYNGVHVDPDTGARAPGGIMGPIHGEQLEEGLPGAGEEGEEEAAPSGGGHEAPAPEAAAPEAAPAPEAAAAPEEGAAPEGAAPEEAAQPADEAAAPPQAAPSPQAPAPSEAP